MESSLTQQYDSGSRPVKALAVPEEIVRLTENFESDLILQGSGKLKVLG